VDLKNHTLFKHPLVSVVDGREAKQHREHSSSNKVELSTSEDNSHRELRSHFRNGELRRFIMEWVDVDDNADTGPALAGSHIVSGLDDGSPEFANAVAFNVQHRATAAKHPNENAPVLEPLRRKIRLTEISLDV
jgi:hypothetical protein